MRENKKVIFICGAPHSGSTLLGLILGSHRLCFYAGELNKTKFININGDHEDKYCKVCGYECPIWKDFNLKDEIDLYNYLSIKTYKPNIIDSTKNLDWLKNKTEKLYESSVPLYLIYILRDGRAVVNSLIRKYKNSDPSALINKWINHIISTNEYFGRFPGEKKKIHYEKLALNPEKTIEKICTFLNIEFNKDMLNYFSHEHHPLGGNIGTQYLIIKSQKEKKEKSPIQLSERNEYYYSDHPLEIKLDLRWKKELSPEIIQLFENKAGELNRNFRFDK